MSKETSKSGIHIKPSHRGLLHKNLGIKQGEKIPASKLKVKKTDSAAVKKRKIFAQNAKKWHHGDDGISIPPPPSWISNFQDPYLDSPPVEPDMSVVPIHQTSSSLYNKVSPDMMNRNHPSYEVMDYTPPEHNSINWGNAATSVLMGIDALIPPEKIKNPVVRPGMVYNQHPYGTGSQAIMKYGGAVDAGNTQWLSEYNYGNNGIKMYHPASYASQGMYIPKTYENGGCMNCGGKMTMPEGGKVVPTAVDRYSAWGTLGNTVQQEGWKPTMWNKDYTEYMPNYNAAGRRVMIGDKPTGNVVVRGGNNGMFDIIIRDSEGQHPDFYVKRGTNAQDAHNYFTNQQSTVNQRVNQLQPYSQTKESRAIVSSFEDGGEVFPYGDIFENDAVSEGYEGEAKDGKWIQKAVNPKHKGYCTPMTKSTCTPRRKALARTFKKHHGFHEDGGEVKAYYEEGGVYNMSKAEMANLISQGYDIELL